jgi:hypothetical protein
MLEPFRPEKAVPVMPDPIANRDVAQVSPRFLTLDPFVPESFEGAAVV